MRYMTSAMQSEYCNIRYNVKENYPDWLQSDDKYSQTDAYSKEQ